MQPHTLNVIENSAKLVLSQQIIFVPNVDNTTILIMCIKNLASLVDH